MTGRNRPAFAVATAAFALVVVGALALGTLMATTQEMRSGGDAILQTRAMMAAELGIDQTIAIWNRQWNGALGRGFHRRLSFATAENARLTVHINRLTDELFLITSDARAGSARRQISRTVRLGVDEPLVRAAVAIGPAVNPSVAASADGTDRAPTHWDCAQPSTPLPSVAIDDTSALLRFGQFDWAQLVALASARLTRGVISPAPRLTEEECDTTDPQNWGEPTKSNPGSCASHYPIIHASEDLIVSGGRGQGLLLVDGDLTLQGGVEFFGVVLVRGAIIGGPGGARITGAVAMAGQSASAPALDGVAIALSRCVARKALISAAHPVPVVERSWTEVFAEP